MAKASFEQDLVVSATVSDANWPEADNHADLDPVLQGWSRRNAKLNLSGALLISDGCIVHVLEGPVAAVQKMRRSVALSPLHSNIRLLAERAKVKRRFSGWPLAYVGPSRWVRSALAHRPLAEMPADSPQDADFVIELLLSFVGEGPYRR